MPAGDSLRVPYSKDTVKDAPHAQADGRLSPEEEAALYRHYGLAYGGEQAATGHDTSGPNTDHAMTRSEEELRVVVTDAQTVSEDLRKERIEVEGDIQR